jgi:hypothetical protein
MSAGDALGGAGKGAKMGASLGSVVPGIGNVIGGAIGAIGGGIGGLLHGRSRRKAAEQAAQNAAKLARIDTEYSPFVGQKGYQVQPEEYTPGGGLSALAGGATGAAQGYNIYKGLQKDAAQQGLIDSLKNQDEEKNAYLSLAKDAVKFPGGFSL